MKDIKVVFKEKFEDIINLIKERRYSNCFSIAKDLTKISATFELKDEVFISEIMEGVFKQTDEVLEEYQIPNKDKDVLNEALLKHMEQIAKSYDIRNMNKVYEELKEMRYIATTHQFTAWQKYKSIPRYEYGRRSR